MTGTRLRPDSTGRLAHALYADGQYALLWSALPDPQPDAVWVLRAAAVHLDPTLRGRQREIAAHFQKSADPLGRFLAGLEHPAALKPASLRETCRDAYYLGVVEEGDGHLSDASTWYRVAVETEQTDAPEFRWARAKLQAWSKEPQRLVRAPAAGAEARQLRP